MCENNDNVDYSNFILNEKNKLISKNDIQNLLANYGVNHEVNNLSIFQTAMTHVSYLRDFSADKLSKLVKDKNTEPIKDLNIAIPLQFESYERLEFLGDSVIHLILAEYLYIRYPDEDEGFMTKLRAKMENGDILARLSKQLKLHDFVLIARTIEINGGREKNIKMFEDVFEAFIGALYIDSSLNFELCKSFVIKIIENHVDIADLINNDTNYKDTLLQYCHKMKWPDPVYKLVSFTEKDNKKLFKMGVVDVAGDIIGVGIGSSKKKGEQLAALQALIKYNIIGENNDDDEEEIIDV